MLLRLMCNCKRGFWMRLLPISPSDFKRVDIEIPPPGHLIAGLMQLPVMTTAEGYREFIADLQPDCSRLRKTQVMRIGRRRPHTRHGCEATNFRCALSRSRLGWAMAS